MKKTLTIIILGLTVLFSGSIAAQKHQSQLIPLDKSFDPTENSRIARYHDSVRLLYDLYFDNVVAQALNDLGNEAPQGTLANILAYALFQYGDALSHNLDGHHIDLALLNFGGIREPIPAGPITIGKLFSVLPFDNNTIAVIELKGSELKKMFFNNLKQLKNTQPMHNTQIVYSNGTIESVTIGGKPIDDNRTYRMATINFIENGGDKILENVETKNLITETEPFRTRIIDFFNSEGEIRGTKDLRVVIK